MKYQMLGVASLVILGGCVTGPTTEQYEKMAENLSNINKNLEAINKAFEKQNSIVMALDNVPKHSSNRGNLFLLGKIEKLPEKPTEKQVEKYLRQIGNASIGQNSFSSNDVQVQMIKSIGKGHFKTILKMLNTGNNHSSSFLHHLKSALPSLVDESDKEEVIKNLEVVPELAPVVIKMGWGEECKDKLLNILEISSNTWELQNLIGPLLKNDKDRERVINVFIKGSNSFNLFSTIKTFPNVDLADISSKAWEIHKFSYEWQRNQYALNAAEYGNINALESLIINFNSNRNFSHYGSNATGKLLKLTGQPLIPRKMLEWYNTNKDKLYFDKEAGSFKVKE